MKGFPKGFWYVSVKQLSNLEVELYDSVYFFIQPMRFVWPTGFGPRPGWGIWATSGDRGPGRSGTKVRLQYSFTQASPLGLDRSWGMGRLGFPKEIPKRKGCDFTLKRSEKDE